MQICCRLSPKRSMKYFCRSFLHISIRIELFPNCMKLWSCVVHNLLCKKALWCFCWHCVQLATRKYPCSCQQNLIVIMCQAGVVLLLCCCRHLHQLLDMPTHTPNMVNMMMQTRAVSSGSPSQDVPAALTSQLGAKTDLAQHTQQLGEPSISPYIYKYIAGALKRATQDCTHPTLDMF